MGHEPFVAWLRHLTDMVGADKIMFATDAPHPNFHLRLPQWAQVFKELPKEFSEEEKALILGGTAAKVLKLEKLASKKQAA
jgi:predicted TIM-barrel fold metal-dependent hydrolase